MRQVVRWFDYLWTDGKSSVDESILEELPESFQAEIAMNVHLDTLKRVAIFQVCSYICVCVCVCVCVCIMILVNNRLIK